MLRKFFVAMGSYAGTFDLPGADVMFDKFVCP